MAVQARPDDEDTPREPTVHELLVRSQRRADDVDARLVRLLDRVERPAQLRNPMRLTAAQLTDRDDAGAPCASFGVLNTNPVTVYLGVGGTAPRPGQGALSVPPNSMMVLPFSIDVLEVGLDVDEVGELDGAAAVVHTWRYETVQPPFLGSA